MESYLVFKDLAIIIIAAKLCGIAARKCKAPQVVGEIVAGLLIGPSILGWVNQSDFLVQMAEIGVILLMFSAGLETDLKDLLKTGPIAALIACAGVFVPLILGALLYMAFFGIQGCICRYDSDCDVGQHYGGIPERNGEIKRKSRDNDFKCSHY